MTKRHFIICGGFNLALVLLYIGILRQQMQGGKIKPLLPSFIVNISTTLELRGRKFGALLQYYILNAISEVFPSNSEVQLRYRTKPNAGVGR